MGSDEEGAFPPQRPVKDRKRRTREELEAKGATRFPCEICGKSFTRRRDVKRHADNAHGSKETATTPAAKPPAATARPREAPFESSAVAEPHARPNKGAAKHLTPSAAETPTAEPDGRPKRTSKRPSRFNE